MPTFAMTKEWADSTVLLEADLDYIRDDITTFLNTTKLDSDNIQANGVSRANLVAVGQQLSSSTSIFQSQSATYTDVTNATISITTTGRPVVLTLVPDGTTDPMYLALLLHTNNDTGTGYCKMLRDATGVAEYNNTLTDFGSGDGTRVMTFPPPFFIDTPAAGTYTYKLQTKVDNTDNTVMWKYAKLIAYEL